MDKEKKINFSCVDNLEQNPPDVFLKVSFILLKLIHNVLLFPADPKFRKIRLENPSIKKYVLPAVGAMECLFEMGFQEGDDCLILPEKAPLQTLKLFQSEIQNRRNKASQPKPKPNESTQTRQPSLFRTTPVRSCNSSSQPSSSDNFRNPENEVFASINTYVGVIMQYENEALKETAKNLVPISKIIGEVENRIRSVQSSAIKNGTIKDLNETSLQQILFLEALMLWFKQEFFTWMNNPKCTFCQSPSTVFLRRSNDPKETQPFDGASVEMYQCQICANRVMFPRYNDVSKLLKTRSGRCGEWAICFTFFCRTFGYDARVVLDWTDHLWTEVYIFAEQRWIHFDCCEGVLDSPLMYDIGWKKPISYVMAFCRDEVQDVTWRYASNFASVLERRTSCSEEALAVKIKNATDSLRSNFSPARLKYLRLRQVRELTDFLSPPQPKSGEKFGGRLSGSLAWRVARGETVNHQPFIWTPSDEEMESKVMIINYSCAKDEYSRACGNRKFNKCLSGWQRGLFSYENVFRKEEMDWKKVYLCRTEYSDVGCFIWKFNVESSGLEIDFLNIVFSSETFNEKVSIILTISSMNENIISLPVTELLNKTINELRGKTEFIIKVELRGGEGDHAWQHAQVFRQSSDNSVSETVTPFCVAVHMRQRHS